MVKRCVSLQTAGTGHLVRLTRDTKDIFFTPLTQSKLTTHEYISSHLGKCDSPTQHRQPRKWPTRHNWPTCWAGIVNTFGTDKNVCPLGGGADSHKSQQCQPGLKLGMVQAWVGQKVLKHYILRLF